MLTSVGLVECKLQDSNIHTMFDLVLNIGSHSILPRATPPFQVLEKYVSQSKNCCPDVGAKP